MANKSYSEKLLDPRWQKKRLEIFTRDEWKCSKCKDDKTTLHIHHLKYHANTEPWEYDNMALITVCETCHKIIEGCKEIPGFNINNLACHKMEEGNIKLYRYEDRTPVIINNGEDLLALSRSDAMAIIKILKYQLHGKKIHGHK